MPGEQGLVTVFWSGRQRWLAHRPFDSRECRPSLADFGVAGWGLWGRKRSNGRVY